MSTIAGKQTLSMEGLHVRDLRKQVDSLKEFISPDVLVSRLIAFKLFII